MIALRNQCRMEGGREGLPCHRFQRRLTRRVPSRGGGCGGGEHKQSSGQTTAASAQTTAKIVRATERQRLHALLHHDFDTAQKLHASEFELINPLGETVSKEAYIDSGDAFAYTEWKSISPIRDE